MNFDVRATPAPPHPPVRVHAIGDFSPVEFQPVATMLRERSDVVFDASPAAACERVEHTGRRSEIVVVAENRPGELRRRDLDRLRQWMPLARFLGLLGPWCEGEARSGTPWPGMIRTYWHRWPARWGEELRRGSGGRRPSWSLSPAAGEEERLLAQRDEPATIRPDCIIGIVSQTNDTADLLAAACRGGGYPTIAARAIPERFLEGLTLLIWEGPPGRIDQFRLLGEQHPTVPRLAVLNFPRWQDVEQFSAAGASGVLSQPFLLEELRFQIQRAVGQNEASHRSAVA